MRGITRERVRTLYDTLRWLPRYVAQRATRRGTRARPLHVMLALADHFEPSILPGRPGAHAEMAEQERRLARWCREYPEAVARWRDADGRPFRHTYFYPAEQYDKRLIDRLAEHCHAGWGEIEVHLHHGVSEPATAESTRRELVEFRDQLAARGCLSRWDGDGAVRYAFVHGNWALANVANGYACGVDEEMAILADTGCYADMTLPSAPHPTQIGKINALYECSRPLTQRAPHRTGRDLRVGRPPHVFPLMVQGPLAARLIRPPSGRPRPRIENGEVTGVNPPTPARMAVWQRTRITVAGRPDWLFVKLHCHGMDPRDEGAMLGRPLQDFLTAVTADRSFALHFVTAREMVNVILAACDGRDGNPGEYRDYRLRPITALRTP
jgi:hypothetical protein